MYIKADCLPSETKQRVIKMDTTKYNTLNIDMENITPEQMKAALRQAQGFINMMIRNNGESFRNYGETAKVFIEDAIANCKK